MSIEYIVNGEVCKNLGEVIGAMKTVDAWKAKPRPKATGSQRVNQVHEATRSNGFTVYGFSPESVAKAQKARAVIPWDIEAWMRNARPEKGRGRPFEIAAAADRYAALLRKAGWIGVRVEQHLSRREDDLPPLF